MEYKMKKLILGSAILAVLGVASNAMAAKQWYY